MQTSFINFEFPTFGLSIEHNDRELIVARFYNPETDVVPTMPAKISSFADEVVRQLKSYVKDSKFKFDLPYTLSGTEHQLKVWHLMENLKPGECVTYGQAAHEIKSAPRAVGGACGKNPLPVIVPCHRIIAANNALGGFNSGNIFFSLGIKKWLLEHEGVFIK